MTLHPLGEAPSMDRSGAVIAPALTGTGTIGAPLWAEPCTGSGAATTTFQWCRDGVPIAGATGRSYVPTAQDDCREITCRIASTGAAGGAATSTAAIIARFAPPQADAAHPLDEIIDVSAVDHRLETAGHFRGEALRFGVIGRGASIDPVTGSLFLSAASPRMADPVVVTAANSGGAAEIRFLVTVEAAEAQRALAPVERRRTITHRGVTWTFAEPIPCGQYWNGDWFAVNPPDGSGLAVVSAAPASQRRATGAYRGKWMHGLVRDPDHPRRNGFDESDHAPSDGGGQPVYDHVLNIDPGATGRPVRFAPGEEGSLVKALSLAVAPAHDGTANHLYRSIYADFTILTIVQDVPPARAFRPAPHGAAPMRDSRWTLDDLDLAALPRAAIEGVEPRGYHSLPGVMQTFRGPWPSWTLGARAMRAFAAEGVTSPGFDAFYGPHIAAGLGSFFVHLFHDGTPAADRLALAAHAVQIGIDIGEALEAGAAMPTPFWGRVHVVPLLVAGLLLRHEPFLKAAGSADSAETDPWHRFWGQGPAAEGFPMNGPVTEEMISLIPPEGAAMPQGFWPRAVPFSREMIGHPYFGWTGGRSGLSASPNNWYAKAAMSSLLVEGLVGLLDGGEAALGASWTIRAFDRVARWQVGHHRGRWDLNARRADTPDFTRSGHHLVWTRAQADLWVKLRGRIGEEPWTGNPEQPSPPILSLAAGGGIAIAMTDWQPDSGLPIVRRQYRYRQVAFSGTVTDDDAAEAIFRSAAPWIGPIDFDGDATLPNLAPGWYQVQVRTGNDHAAHDGWSAWSTNVPWRSDGAAVAGLPPGPRAVIRLG